MIIKEESKALEIKIGVMNLSFIIIFFASSGAGVASLVGTGWALIFVCVVPTVLWINAPYVIAELVKSVKELKPDGWLMAAEGIWNY